MKMIDQLFDAVAQKRNPSILGLDTRLEYLPQPMLDTFDPGAPFESAVSLLKTFNLALMDAVQDIIPCVKLQSAYYEMYGPKGVQLLDELVAEAKARGFVTICDGKRNDIGSTAEAYAFAYLDHTPFPDGQARASFDADFLTVTPYLGKDGIVPFVDACQRQDKGIFVLVKTSNPSSGQLQDLEVDGRPIYDHVAQMVTQCGEPLIGAYGYSSIGAVVGATYPEQGAALRKAYASLPFLVPGYGAQGAKGSDLALCFDKDGFGAAVNASRSLLCAHKKSDLPYAQATRQAAITMQQDLLHALEAAGRLAY